MRISDWSSDVCSSDLHPFDSVGHGFGHGDGILTLFLRHGDGDRGHFAFAQLGARVASREGEAAEMHDLVARAVRHRGDIADLARAAVAHRSDEHTSELKSLMRLSYAVFCLKQKKTRP